MSISKPRIILNQRDSSLSSSSNDILNQLSKLFSSDEGCRLLSKLSSEEYKLLQDTKEILEERILLDKKYAQDLQELTAKADRIEWPTDKHSIASACYELLMQWSYSATKIDSNADEFQQNILDNLIKNLLEQKNDSKKFFEDQKRLYDTEHRKAQNDVIEAEKRYSNEAKLYAAKNNEFTKASATARIGDKSRIEDTKRLVIEKRDNVYRAHNEYVLTIREYNFIDEQYIRKIHNLLVYHEEVQLILNRQWQNLLKSIANYMKNDISNSCENFQEFYSFDPRHCYDEICKQNSNIPLLTINPIIFNETLLQTSGLSHLKANKIIVDDSTINDLTIDVLRQKIQMLTDDIDKSNKELINILQEIDQIKDKKTSYYERKHLFEQEQQAENLRIKIAWIENLKNDLQEVFDDAGIVDDTISYQEIPTGLSDRLEDQTYFYGLMPRAQIVGLLKEKGDYLLRINDQGRIVLSILWTDSTEPNKLKDGHFLIHEKDNMYSFQMNSIGKQTVPKLITYYTRQKLELRDDGTRLIRPIEKPDYIINNDEIKIFEKLGSGNFGEVIRGEYRNVPVAVKILHSIDVNQSSKDRENFVREALILKRYKHKRIVNCIGIAAYREPLMIVMEIVEQGSLNNYLKANELRVSQLIQMCYEIAKGMAYLESCHVIHRDLATRNCLVDKNGRIKVGDFGLSRCLQDDEEYFSQTKQFPVRWWAVEVLSKGPYTNKSDVWSYGITAWEIFSKAIIPYTHIQHNHLIIDAVKRGERLKQPDKCPANIYAIMANCWLFNPKDRPNFEKIVELLKKEKFILPKFLFFDMPHLLVSTRIRLESGPTILGDERLDPELMAQLGAQLFHEKCNNYSEYRTEDCVRIVLDKLETFGYRVLSMTGIGQTCIWLLHKD